MPYLKYRIVPIIVIITNTINVQISYSCLDIKIFEVGYHPWQYSTIIDHEVNSNSMRSKPIPLATIEAELNNIKAEEHNETDSSAETTKEC